VELSGDRPVVVIGRDFAYMTTGRLKGVALWIEARRRGRPRYLSGVPYSLKTTPQPVIN